MHDGIRVHRVPSRMFPKVTSLPLGVPRPRMVGVLRGFDPDVVHLASPALLGYGGLHAARLPRRPDGRGIPDRRRGFRGELRHRRSRRAPRGRGPGICTARADRTLAPSTSAMENLAAHRIPRVYKWARGVDVTGFAPSARDVGLRRLWSPDGKPIVGFVGRLAPEKHVERLAVLARATTCRSSSSATASTAPSSKSSCRQRFSPAPCTATQLAAAYATMDVFVHPGEHETFCQAVQEAMASGLPVIAPDAGGPRDLVAPYRTGLLLPVDEFEAGCRQSVDHLVAERRRYSMAARRSVLGRTWPVICDELLGHYEAVQRRTSARRLMLAGRQIQPCASIATGCHSSQVSSRLS